MLTPRSSGQIRSLAVLPFVNLSNIADQEYFADGMTDQLITELCKIHSVRVISRTSAMEFKGKHQPLPEIARTLNVDGIITATVLRSGEKVRINAQLIRGATDENLWGETYERNTADILPDFDCLRDDPRFATLISRLQLPVGAYCTLDQGKSSRGAGK